MSTLLKDLTYGLRSLLKHPGFTAIVIVQNTVFEHLAAILTRPANLALSAQAERIDLAMASANFFSVSGAEPLQVALRYE